MLGVSYEIAFGSNRSRHARGRVPFLFWEWGICVCECADALRVALLLRGRLLGCCLCPSNLRLEATVRGTREARTFYVLGIGFCVCECVEEIASVLLLRD